MIEVQIAKDKNDANQHDTLVGIKIIGSLKAAGIPVIGNVFTMRGIERGTLTYTNQNDLDGPMHVYIWCEDGSDTIKGKPLRSKNAKTGALVTKYGRHAEEDDEL